MAADQLAIFLTPQTEEFENFDRAWYVVHTCNDVDDVGEVCVHFMGPHAETRRTQQRLRVRKKRKAQICDAKYVQFSLAWSRSGKGREIYQQTKPAGHAECTAWVPASSIKWCGMKLGHKLWGKVHPTILDQLPSEMYTRALV